MLETANQMHSRLLGVIAKSRFEALARPYAWQPMPDSRGVPTGALAAVNDGHVWYALAPVTEGANDSYRIFAFHFAEGTNASGFVAWLAGHTPALWQTSLGLFDYWSLAQGRPRDGARGTSAPRWIERSMTTSSAP
jgi:hypothetical protein